MCLVLYCDIIDHMDENTPDNVGMKNEKVGKELVNLLREFLELELTALRLEQENRELEAEEEILHEEQYGEDAAVACFAFLFALDNC